MDIDGVETVIGVHSYGTHSCYVSSTATRVDAYAASFLDRLVKSTSPTD